MKKFIFIFIAFIIFLLIYASISNHEQPIKQEDTSVTEALPENTQNCVCKSECICSEGDSDCDCKRSKVTCECTKPDGKTVTFEAIATNNDDIEESNPEETADEDESIVAE